MSAEHVQRLATLSTGREFLPFEELSQSLGLPLATIADSLEEIVFEANQSGKIDARVDFDQKVLIIRSVVDFRSAPSSADGFLLGGRKSQNSLLSIGRLFKRNSNTGLMPSMRAPMPLINPTVIQQTE